MSVFRPTFRTFFDYHRGSRAVIGDSYKTWPAIDGSCRQRSPHSGRPDPLGYVPSRSDHGEASWCQRCASGTVSWDGRAAGNRFERGPGPNRTWLSRAGERAARPRAHRPAPPAVRTPGRCQPSASGDPGPPAALTVSIAHCCCHRHRSWLSRSRSLSVSVRRRSSQGSPSGWQSA